MENVQSLKLFHIIFEIALALLPIIAIYHFKMTKKLCFKAKPVKTSDGEFDSIELGGKDTKSEIETKINVH